MGQKKYLKLPTPLTKIVIYVTFSLIVYSNYCVYIVCQLTCTHSIENYVGGLTILTTIFLTRLVDWYIADL